MTEKDNPEQGIRAIRVREIVRIEDGKPVLGYRTKLVKETNPYFEWYKKSKGWKVVEEFVMPDKRRKNRMGRGERALGREVKG
jgi:hypothetical protein